MRALGIKLGELLESGDRFTVKLRIDEPSPWVVEQYREMPYMENVPEYRYWLEIGAIHEREVVFAVVPEATVGLPPTSITATPANVMLTELASRAFAWTRYFTATARDREIEQFNKWMGS